MINTNYLWKRLETVFKDLGREYLRQGSLASIEDFPDTFYTFWNERDSETAYYDNDGRKMYSVWRVCSYTNDPKLMYSLMDEFILKAKANGFILVSDVVDIPSDRPDFYGRTALFTFIDKENKYAENEF